MVLDPGEGQGEVVLSVLVRKRRIGQQRDGLALPQAPGLGGLDLSRTRRSGEAAMIGADQVGALVRRDRRQKGLPLVRKQPGRALLIVPLQFGMAQGRISRAGSARSRGRDVSRHRPAPATTPTSRRTPAIHRCRSSGAGARCRRRGARSCWRRGWHAGSSARSRAGRRAGLCSGRGRTAGGGPANIRRPDRHAGRPPACRPGCRRIPSRRDVRRRHRETHADKVRSADRGLRRPKGPDRRERGSTAVVLPHRSVAHRISMPGSGGRHKP